MLLSAQGKIEKNPHVNYQVTIKDDHYLVEYTFKDPFNNLQNYSLSIPINGAHQMIERFGIPKWMFEPYVETKANLDYRKQILKEGLFRLRENTIEVDKNAVVEYYSESVCKPIANMIVRSLAEYGMDTPRNRAEFAIRFVQDIPYGIPNYEDRTQHYGGVSPPPKLLIEGFGDCDSKVLLFAGIMIYLIPAEDFIFLNQPKHVLSAIRAKPEKGLTYVRFEGEPYLIAETAGPGKRLLGQEGNYYRDKFTPERLYVRSREIIPAFDLPGNRLTAKPTHEFSQSQTIILQNTSNRTLRFQISHDQIEWQSYHLEGRQNGQFEFDDNNALFIRFKETRNKYVTYRIVTGKAYTFKWNGIKKRWEFQS